MPEFFSMCVNGDALQVLVRWYVSPEKVRQHQRFLCDGLNPGGVQVSNQSVIKGSGEKLHPKCLVSVLVWKFISKY